ncbi:MAG: hypothetical protein DPW09_11055 [Anaerolineae bacterium]|nr:hypothetical protein [Anaerolineae bacterium]
MASTQSPQVTIGELLRRHRQAAGLKQKELAKLFGYSDTIVSRLETGNQQPQPEYIEQFIKVLQLDEAQRAELLMVYQQSGGAASFSVPAQSRYEDWGEAPDVSIFFGRQEELAELSQWLTTDHCRLVAVIGMGGIGKTTLVTKLAEQIKDQFDYVLWRSLRNAPPLTDLLTDCLKFLSNQQRTDLPGEVSAQMNLLIDYLRQKRCLFILDNLEAILQAETHAGEYREGYEAYGQVVQRVGESAHQSCMVLTSREKPKELIPLAGITRPVRTMALPGLDQPDSRALLQDRELQGDESAWAALTQRYAGNPLALRQVSATIQDLYSGEIITFLKEITTMFGEIRYLLEQQFNRLSKLEQDVMYWLAINREPVSIPDLREDLVQPVSTGELAEAMESLLRRSLIEKSAGRFTLQNVIMEYVTDRLIERVCEEIMLGSINLLQSHALMKATAKEYVRESQVRLILGPVTNRLLDTIGKENIIRKLRQIISTLQQTQPRNPCYTVGNVLNVLRHLKIDLIGYDFSNLNVWQAYLQEMDLQDVQFAYADLTKSVFTGTFGVILSVSFSQDGEFLVAGTENGDVRLWQVSDSQALKIFKVRSGWLRSLALSPDGNTFAHEGDNHSIQLRDIKTGQLIMILQGHKDSIWSIGFSSDGRILASGSHDQTIRLWDINSGQCLETLHEHTNKITSIAFSSNGHTLASGSYDKTIRLWNMITGQLLATLWGHVGVIWAVAFSPDGNLLASSSEDQSVRLWDIKTGQCIRILNGHTGGVWSVSFCPQGVILASGSRDQSVRLWDVQTGQCLKILQGHTDRVWSVSFSSDGRILASGSRDQTVRLWDAETGQCFNTIRGHADIVWAVTCSPDGSLLASGSGKQAVRLWDINMAKCLKTLKGHSDLVSSVSFCPQGVILASGSRDQSIRLWDVQTGQCLKILQGHTGWILSVSFSSDGRILASGSLDQTVRLWDAETGQCFNTLKHAGQVESVCFSPDGCMIASGGNDYAVWLWDTKTGQCFSRLQGHVDELKSVAFSPDGCLLARFF